MHRSELSGLVLTHGDRNPNTTVEQLSTVAEQVVVVFDSRFGEAPDLPLLDNCEITLLERDFDTFPAQRNAGIEKALGSWVLSVDSDELLTRDLSEEIAALKPDDEIDFYDVPRSEIVRKRQLTTGALYGGHHPRLFRSNLRYAPVPVVHEEFNDFGNLTADRLSSSLVHAWSEGAWELMKKTFQYGRQWSETRESPYSWLQVIGSAPNSMVRKHYWRDGADGLVVAGLHTAFRLGTRM